MNRYWVGGSGNWNDTSHWSVSSGGSGGASVPSDEDNVFIDENSGFEDGGEIEISYGTCGDLICTSGHEYTIRGLGYSNIDIGGSLELEPGITWEFLDIFLSGEGTIKTNGVKLSQVYIHTIFM